MTTLRNKQKQLRKSLIFQAAVELFTKNGYAATSMEDLARHAGVSVPTVYAYYASKAELILALYEADRDIVSKDKVALIANPPDNATQAIKQLILIELTNGADYCDNEMWRELVAAGIKAGNPEYHANLDQLNKRVFDEPMADLLRALQVKKLICDDINIENTVALFSDLTLSVFHQQISYEHPWSWVEDRIERTVETAVSGLST